MQKKLTFVISGPSGVGKGTICKRLAAEVPGVALSVSCTTREPRRLEDGTMEIDGIHYHFIKHPAFEKRIEEGDFFEYAVVHDEYYGSSRSFVEQQKAAGSDVILEIDMQGALQVKAADPEAVLIYILPPNYEELKKRLIGRGSETPEKAAKRLRDAGVQLSYAYAYDYVLVNDNLDEAVRAVEGIISASRLSTATMKPVIDQIKRSFKEVL